MKSFLRQPAATRKRQASFQILLRRRGGSLIDIVAATVLTVLTIVPCAKIMQGALDLNRKLELRQEMTLRCSTLIEEQLARQSLSFRNRKAQGVFNDKNESLRYELICSDSASFGGVPSQVMGVYARVWHDLDRDRRRDQGEPEVALFTTTSRP